MGIENKLKNKETERKESNMVDSVGEFALNLIKSPSTYYCIAKYFLGISLSEESTQSLAIYLGLSGIGDFYLSSIHSLSTPKSDVKKLFGSKWFPIEISLPYSFCKAIIETRKEKRK